MDSRLIERVTHNHYMQKAGGNYHASDIETIKEFVNLFIQDGKVKEFDLPKYKVGLMFIAINPHYHQFVKDVTDSARKFFLPGHDVEMLLWSDMPVEATFGTTRFKVEGAGWPAPTLHRYDYFLEQEEYLKKFDYIFFCDIDMKFVNYVGDEVLGTGLTGALHPMYAVRKKFRPPFEANPNSTAYIKMPTHYFAGGFQGGKTKLFIKAMKHMKKKIDEDKAKGVTALWNDEGHWNRYLFDNPPSVVLSPSYIYPDSIIEEYYKKAWGRDYPAKLVTVTKIFSLTQATQDDLQNELKTL